MGDSKGAHILSLPQLQNLIKRDPESYRDEFLTKYSYYKETLGIFQQKPTGHDENLVSVVTFLSQVAQCYTDVMADFPQDLLTLLHHQGPLLDSDMRMTFCQALMLLRRKGLVPATTVLELCFRMFRCPDKLLRKTLYSYIVQDIKRVNAKHKNARLNVTLQNFMYTMLRDNHQIAAKMSIDVMIDLYRRNVWNDTKTVNVIKEALFCKFTKVLVAALKFFLGSDGEGEDGDDSDSDSEPDAPKKSSKELLTAHRVAKKSRKRQRRLDRALLMLKKNKKKQKPESFNFSAIHLIHDPQGLAEKLFGQLETSCRNERHEVKLMVTNLISRLVGIHQLQLENFYPYIAKKFIGPHRRDVTKYLLFLAQASHELVPPDIITAVVQEVVNNFVNDKSSSEVMAVGINAVREICARCPLAMDADLLQYLSEHRTHRDKSVQMAARSLIQVFREKNPHLLHHKYKGRPTQAMKEAEVLEYAKLNAKDYIPGAEVLRETAEIVEQQKQQDEWESCSSDEEDDASDDGSWVDVHHSSDDEQQPAAAADNSVGTEDKVERSRRIVESRLLTQEEFKQIQSRQLAKQLSADQRNGRGTKRKRQDSDAKHDDREVVPLSSIEFVHKKRQHDRESRLATVMAGREGRDKFGRPSERQNPNSSSTNKQKKKTKNFMMVKHKIQKSKGKRTFQDKQIALKKALINKIKRRKK
jgi:protein SDA1